jgi:hypothetical protein
MTKGEVHELNLEIDEIEQELDVLDPNHWFESRRISQLDNRLLEIQRLLSFNPNEATCHLHLV